MMGRGGMNLGTGKIGLVRPLLYLTAGGGLLFLACRLNQLDCRLFHTAVKFLSVAVAWSVFVTAFSTRSYARTGYFLFVGLACLFIAGLDFLHVLTFAGGAAQPGPATWQLWLAARITEGLTFFAATCFIARPVSAKGVFALYLILFAGALLSIFRWRNFPPCFTAGAATPFTTICEHRIALLFGAGLVNVLRSKEHFASPAVYTQVLAAYGAALAAELMFVRHINTYDFFSVAGHFLKLVAYITIHQALVSASLHLPYLQLQKTNAAMAREMARLQEEDRRRRHEQEMSRLSRLVSISTAACSLAHDFKNTLTIILGNASLAHMHSREEKVRKNLVNIANAARQGAELANRLLDYARNNGLSKEQADLVRLVRETALLAASGARIRCSFSLPDTPLLAEVDTAQIGQVVNNIVLNAIQAMPQDGFLHIEMSREWVESRADLPLEAGNYIRIAFRDHGTGIPPEDLEKIFMPFFTTKANGSGLGLPTSFSIIKKHGGHITVDSTPGQGTTFALYLPALTAPQQQAAAETAAALSPDPY